MGSDSRTATATSSKARPSWRNRHLSQLTDEQLSEVKQHRDGHDPEEGAQSADESSAASVARMAGIESVADESVRNKSVESKAKIAPDANLPKRQAGPERELEREPNRQPDRQPGHEYRQDVVDDRNRQPHARNRTARYESEDHKLPHSTSALRESPERGGQRRSEYSQKVQRSIGQQPEQQSRSELYDGSRPDQHQGDRSRRRPEYQREYNRGREPEHRRSHPEQSRNRSRDERSAPQARRDHAAPVRESSARREAERHYRDSVPAQGKRSDTPHAPTNLARKNNAHVDSNLQTDHNEGKKGIVARLLDFNMPWQAKYGLMAVAIAAMIAVSVMKPIDNSSQSQLDSALTRAMIGFGLARTLNGVISVAQGTEFAVQPAGVGVNFSPGEILDPINDLVERFSWVMLLATSSLGVQKILLEVSSWAGISVLLAGAGLFFLLTRLRNSSVARMADIAGKLLLALILVRFLIPVGSLANDWVYKQFLQPQYEESAAQLELASERIREISTRQTQAEETDGSLTERARKFYNSMTSKFDFDGMLDDYKNSAENVSEHAISLIVVFMLQTVVFPLLFLYLIYRLFRSVLLPPRALPN